METPVSKRKDSSADGRIWSQSPLVFTSPGGSISTKGRVVKADSSLKLDDKLQGLRMDFVDENVQSRSCVSIPSAYLMPSPRLRSSFSSQITPLKANNRQNNSDLFAFSVDDLKKAPSTTGPKLHRSMDLRPPMTGKKQKQKTVAQFKAIEEKERELKKEAAMRKQEKLYISWLNLTLREATSNEIFTPEVELEDFNKEPSLQTGIRRELTQSSAGNGLQALCAVEQLHQRLSSQFDSVSQDEILCVMVQVAKRIDDGKLKMKDGCAVLADVGLKKQAVNVLMSYSAAWLKLGLYTVVGVRFGNETQDSILEAALEKYFFTHSGIAKEYSTNRTVEGLYRQGYLEALGRVILKRLLLLVLVLDKLKSFTALQDGGIDGLDGGSVLLFRKGATVNSSRQALQDILRNAMHGEGDLIAHLSTLGYRLHHVQSVLAEYSFQASSFKDLEDGVTLCRLAQIITKDASVVKKIHLPSDSRKRKKLHCDLALDKLSRAGVSLVDEQGFMIISESILNGDREMILSLLWNVLLQLQIPTFFDEEALWKEVLRIERMNGSSEVASEVLSMPVSDLLLRWTKAVCTLYNFEVQSFKTLFSDGQALCYLVSFYLPTILPNDTIDKCSKNLSLGNSVAANHFSLFRSISSKLGFVDEVLNHCSTVEEFSLWPERNVVFLLGLLCSNFVGTNAKKLQDELQLEERMICQRMESSAIQIQAHCRRWTQKCIYNKIVASTRKIQSTWRRYLARQNMLKRTTAAKEIQRKWRRCIARRHAAETLQAFYRGYKQNSYFRRMIASAISIQATWRGFITRYRFSLQKASVSKIEHWWQTVLEKRKHCEQRSAAIVIQAYYRRWDKRRRFKQTVASIQKIQSSWRGHAFRLQKASAVLIQRCWRWKMDGKHQRATSIQASWRGYLARRSFSEQKKAAICVQSYYRCFVLRKSFGSYRKSIIMVQAVSRRRFVRRRYLQLKAATVCIQQCWRWESKRRQQSATRIQASWRSYLLRRSFTQQKKAAISVQSYYRSFAFRKNFTSYRKIVIMVQAVIRGRFVRKRYQGMKAAVCFIQTSFRNWLEFRKTQMHFTKSNLAARKIQVLRKHHAYRKKVASALAIQAAFHCWIERRAHLSLRKKSLYSNSHSVEEQQARAVTVLQAHWRGFSVRKQLRSEVTCSRYLKIWKSASFSDKWQNKYLQNRKQVAAVTIQRFYRIWRTRTCFAKLRRSACLIQAYWKGYAARKGQNDELMNLRLRIQNTAAIADCNMTLGNRLNAALALLLSFKTVSSILHVCATIDLTTEHSRCCCERIAEGGAIAKIVQLIQTTNRSTPHEQVLKHALSILGHLARYPVLARSILDTHASLSVITEQLQMYRNKEELFFKAVEVIRLVCNEAPQDVVRTAPLVLRRLQHVRQLLERKVEAERKNAERCPPGVNSVGRVSAEKKLAEARLQLQSVSYIIRTLTGSCQGVEGSISQMHSQKTSLKVKLHLKQLKDRR